jgi:hypothetical protein
MSASSSFISLFRNEYDDGRTPVWEPGMPISVGHFGSLSKGRFEYLGDARSMLGDSIFDAVELSEPTGDASFNYGGKFGRAMTGDGDLGPVAKGKLALSFEGTGAARYEAEGIRFERFTQKQLVQQLLRKNTHLFDRGTAFVMEIKRITSGSIFVAETEDYSVELSGSADLLEAKRLGSGEISVANISGIGYERQLPSREGSSGYAVSLQLYVKGWFGMRSLAKTPQDPDAWNVLDPYAVDLDA